MRHQPGRRHTCCGGPVALALLLAPLLMAGCGATSGSGAHHLVAATPPSGTATTVPTGTVAPGPLGQWVTVPGLSGGVPVISPGDPRIIYEVVYDSQQPSSPPILKRSADGGATWQVLPIPGGLVQPGKSSSMNTNLGVIASPTDSRLVFLSVAVPYAGTCPTAPRGASYHTSAAGAGSVSMLSANLPRSGYGQCSFEYRSADAGQTWQQIALPVGGELASPIYAQGDRLYSFEEGDSGEQHLVQSDDGGVTWQPIDGEFATGAHGSLTFMPTQTGSTIFAAIAGPDRSAYTLWRSDDAGASWLQVAHLTGTYMSMQVVDRVGGAPPLLYTELLVPGSMGSTTRFVVSTNGGTSWTDMPANGLPSQVQVDQLALVGQLADGSILVQTTMVPSSESATTLAFYAWKAGQSVWRQVAPDDVSAPQYSIRLLAITRPDASGHQTLWVIQGEGTGAIQRCVLE